MKTIRKKLLIVTSDYFHPLTTRVHLMLPFFREHFDTKIVAVVSSRYDQLAKKDSDMPSMFKFVASILLSSIFGAPVKTNDVTIIQDPLPENRFSFFSGQIIDALLIAMIMKIRKICKGYDICLVCHPLAGFSTLLAKPRTPVVYEDVDRFEFFWSNTLGRKIVRFMEQYCIRNSTEVISAGCSLALSAKSIRDRQVRLVPNGVDLRIFNQSEGPDSSKDPFGIVYVGSISEWSGLEKAIESLPIVLSKFPRARLTIIGTGPPVFTRKLQNITSKLDICRSVAFIGPKKHGELPQLMKGFTVALATFSRTQLMQRYAFPLKIMEYMAAHLPVVATDVGDVGFILRARELGTECGVLVEYTCASIANGINKILGDPDYAVLLAKNCQKRAEDFDLSRLAQKEVNLLLDLAAESVREIRLKW